MARFQAMIVHDRQFCAFGHTMAGMDEVGRGSLFGPVVAACVMMPAEPLFSWVDDSKRLSAMRREELDARIREHALYLGLGEASPREIDQFNILNATRLAMKRAASKAPASLCLVDALDGLQLPFPIRAIVHGDATSYHIAAASIVAKVARDKMMEEWGIRYPHYSLENNKGYGTAAHLAAIRKYGVTPEHRMSFLKNALSGIGGDT